MSVKNVAAYHFLAMYSGPSFFISIVSRLLEIITAFIYHRFLTTGDRWNDLERPVVLTRKIEDGKSADLRRR